jgi:SSS family solute:Na+ symporter
MRAELFTFGSFAFFTAVVGLISYRITRRAKDVGAKGYFMASGGLSGWFIAGSMLLTNLSLEQLVGLNGDAYAHNMAAMAWEVTAVLAIVALALFFLPRYLRGGFSTLPQFLEDRYDAHTRRIVSGLFIIGYTFIVNPSGLYLGAITFNQIFGVQAALGLPYGATITLLVFTSGFIGALYAIFGGLRGVAVSDTINGIGLALAGLMIPILGLSALGHGELLAGFRYLLAHTPEKLNAIGSAHDSVPFATVFTGMLFANLSYWCTNQAIVQRTLAARSLAEGQKGVLLSGLMKLTVPLVTLLPGLIAFNLYVGRPLTRPDLAYPQLVSDLLPFWAKGFFLAALFGTVMSHFNAVVNSTATLVALDFYKPLRPGASDSELIRVGKKVSVGIAMVSLAIAPLLMFASEGIYGVIRKFNGFFNIPIIAIMLVGFFDRRVGALPAKLVLFLHVTIYTVFVIILNIDKITGVHFLHFMGGLFVCEVALMLALRRRFARPIPYVPVLREHGDLTPWRYARSVSILLIAVLVSAYLTLSPIGLARVGGVAGIYPITMIVLWAVALALAARFTQRIPPAVADAPRA